MKITTLALALAVLAVGCGDEEPEGIFSREDAEALALSFGKMWIQGDTKGLLAASRVPFTFQTLGRTWDTEGELKKNLPAQLAALREDFREAEEMEIFSYRDLMKDRWPRGMTVDEADREKVADSWGVQFEGFVVRCFKKGRSGIRLILNPGPDGTRLTVQGVL